MVARRAQRFGQRGNGSGGRSDRSPESHVTDSGGTTPFNSADDNANVDVQAATIYDGVSIVHIHMAPYDPPDGASAEEKFRTGVRNLVGRQASRARALIWEAMMGRYETSEARFYWLIAMLSERTIRQFSDEEISQL